MHNAPGEEEPLPYNEGDTVTVSFDSLRGDRDTHTGTVLNVTRKLQGHRGNSLTVTISHPEESHVILYFEGDTGRELYERVVHKSPRGGKRIGENGQVSLEDS